MCGIVLAPRTYPGEPRNYGPYQVLQVFILRNRGAQWQAGARSIPARSLAHGRSGSRMYRDRGLNRWRERRHGGWHDGGWVRWRYACRRRTWRTTEIGEGASDRRRSTTFKECRGCPTRMIGRSADTYCCRVPGFLADFGGFFSFWSPISSKPT